MADPADFQEHRGRRPGSMRRQNGGGNGDEQGVRERLARLEAQIEHIATKADLQKTENTLIKWMLGTIVASELALVVAVLKTFVA